MRRRLSCSVQLLEDADQRTSPFCIDSNRLDSGAIYHMLKSRGQQPDQRAIFVWQNSAPPRVQLFMWLLTQKRIQCRTVLLQKRVLHDAVCEICHAEEETPEHIISGCYLGALFWQKIGFPDMVARDVTEFHLAAAPTGIPSQELPSFIALCCWQLWKARNAFIFRNEVHTLNQVLGACKATAELWRFRFKMRKKQIAEKWCNIFDMARET